MLFLKGKILSLYKSTLNFTIRNLVRNIGEIMGFTQQKERFHMQ